MLDETTPKAAEEPARKVTVDAAAFQGRLHVPESARAQIAALLQNEEFDTDLGWLEFFQYRVKEAWQERGYFYANVRVEKRISGGDAMHQRISLTVHVDEGPRYRLGNLRFVHAHEFPAEEMRKAFPMRDGDAFNIAKIRLGFEALKRLYGTRGFINFVATPDLQVDKVHGRIAVLVDVDEGKPYRVASVTILGLDQHIADGSLRIKLRPGDLFDPELVKEFYQENKLVLPLDASPEDEQLSENLRDATVALVFDFRGCPQDP